MCVLAMCGYLPTPGASLDSDQGSRWKEVEPAFLHVVDSEGCGR